MLDDCMYVHFSPQLEKSRTFSRTSISVSINSTAGRPSGWAVPRILVVFYCVCTLHLTNKMACFGRFRKVVFLRPTQPRVTVDDQLFIIDSNSRLLVVVIAAAVAAAAFLLGVLCVCVHVVFDLHTIVMLVWIVS